MKKKNLKTLEVNFMLRLILLQIIWLLALLPTVISQSTECKNALNSSYYLMDDGEIWLLKYFKGHDNTFIFLPERESHGSSYRFFDQSCELFDGDYDLMLCPTIQHADYVLQFKECNFCEDQNRYMFSELILDDDGALHHGKLICGGN